jgi:hypothetical protein
MGSGYRIVLECWSFAERFETIKEDEKEISFMKKQRV